MSYRQPYLSVAHSPAWLADLRQLAAKGVSDRNVAIELSRTHAPLVFTRRRVWYWRVQMIEDVPGGKLEDFRSLAEARRSEYRIYQMVKGFSHLLPDYIKPVPGADRHGHWTPGHELTPRQCDVLALLQDLGPLTRAEIAARLGRHRNALYRRRKLCPLDGLILSGLVEAQPGNQPFRYGTAAVVSNTT